MDFFVVFVQGEVFNRTIKQIEGDNVSAMEVGSALNVLTESLEERKNSKFLSMAVKNEIAKVARAASHEITVTKEGECETTDAFFGSYLILYIHVKLNSR